MEEIQNLNAEESEEHSSEENDLDEAEELLENEVAEPTEQNDIIEEAKQPAAQNSPSSSRLRRPCRETDQSIRKSIESTPTIPEINSEASQSDQMSSDASEPSDNESVKSTKNNKNGSTEKQLPEPQKHQFMNIIFAFIWISNILVGLIYFGTMYMPQGEEDIVTFSEVDEPALFKNLRTRSSWDYRMDLNTNSYKKFVANEVAIVQTDTDHCDTPDSCANMLINIEMESGKLEYNFVLSPDGSIYEVLGWTEPSSMFTEGPTMVVAFIGNYEKKMPSRDQLDQLGVLLKVSRDLEYLTKDYTMFGRKIKVLPSKLFDHFEEWKRWNLEKSDTDLAHVEFLDE